MLQAINSEVDYITANNLGQTDALGVAIVCKSLTDQLMQTYTTVVDKQHTLHMLRHLAGQVEFFVLNNESSFPPPKIESHTLEEYILRIYRDITRLMDTPGFSGGMVRETIMDLRNYLHSAVVPLNVPGRQGYVDE